MKYGIAGFQSPSAGKTFRTVLTIKKYLELFENGTIIPYENNRGKIPSSRQAEIIARGFDAEALRSIYLVETGRTLTIIDGHTRTEAMRMLLAKGDEKLKRAMDNLNPGVELCIHHRSRKLRLYELYNEIAPHKLAHALNNPDYSLGRVWVDIRDRHDFSKLLAPTFMRVGAAIDHYGLHKFNTQETNLVGNRLGALSKRTIGAPFKARTITALTEASEFVAQVHRHIKEECTTKDGKSDSRSAWLGKSSGFNLLLLVGFSGRMDISDYSPKEVAKKSLRFYADIKEATKNIIKRSWTFQDEQILSRLILPVNRRHLRSVG